MSAPPDPHLPGTWVRLPSEPVRREFTLCGQRIRPGMDVVTLEDMGSRWPRLCIECQIVKMSQHGH